MTTSSNFWQASDGTTLHYCLDDFTDPWKKADCVVLLHPGMGSALRLYAWVPHLARDYVVVRPDIRGHGKSEPGLDKPLTLPPWGSMRLQLASIPSAPRKAIGWRASLPAVCGSF
ncbi:MAG: hypothetical protein NTW47_21065 [Proteobacteria bacterium]|nr:hypothetical protein [Pseudomonadota bacterium]